MACAELKPLGTVVVHAELKEAVLSPSGTPGVPDDPVLAAVALHVLLGHLAISHKHNTVIDFLVLVRALEEALCDNTGRVGEEHACGNDGHSDGLLVQNLLELIIVESIVLNHVLVLEVPLAFGLLASCCAAQVHRVVILQENAVLLHIGIPIIHPATVAVVVDWITVNQLLDGVLLQLS